ncbi:hypothetical protein VNI00_008576 [Paramarasmius palmivorus]|uniref:Phenazine biosynthesis-like protein n=1 Tax=Paramarasmius palmivorus TaxID=297713 RepID=A0AAW0CZ79_9AGAR
MDRGPVLVYDRLDVFTEKIFSGNPLAIVHLNPSKTISAAEKLLIAKEFNLAETVFLHAPLPTSFVFPIDIFDTLEELPFAGHPTIGAGWYLLQRYPEMETVTLRTKAGDIPVYKAEDHPAAVHLRIPVDFKCHGLHPHLELKAAQRFLDAGDYKNGRDASEPIASIVKGMTFILIELVSEEALAKVVPHSKRSEVSRDIVGDWYGFTAIYFYVILPDGKVRTRMFDGPVEDPATGSAASTLASYLAVKRGVPGIQNFDIVQGVEMGRRSAIAVSVDVSSDGEVMEVDLAGSAVMVMNGRIEGIGRCDR